MNVGLAIAGVISFGLALGHATIGLRWVVPNLTRDRFTSTPFGRSSMTAAMVRFTWHVVTLMLFGFAALIMALSVAEDAEPRTLVLRWLAALWLAASAIALWDVRRRPRGLLRFPVPLLFPVVAALCWMAST